MQLRGSVPAFDDKRQFSLIYRGKATRREDWHSLFKIYLFPRTKKKSMAENPVFLKYGEFILSNCRIERELTQYKTHG